MARAAGIDATLDAGQSVYHQPDARVAATGTICGLDRAATAGHRQYVGGFRVRPAGKLTRGTLPCDRSRPPALLEYFRSSPRHQSGRSRLTFRVRFVSGGPSCYACAGRQWPYWSGDIRAAPHQLLRGPSPLQERGVVMHRVLQDSEAAERVDLKLA